MHKQGLNLSPFFILEDMKIANQHLAASFKTKGAEMTSLIKGDCEYLWQANPKHWGRHAPVLFPVVGKLKKDLYTIDGVEYPMNQHGFARDMEFEIEEHNSDSITFILKSDSETLKVYPFKFELRITYELIGSSVKVNYSVVDTGKGPMLFSIGAHPAFNCPMTSEENRSDYWLQFEYAENLETHLLDGGLFSGNREKVNLSDNKLLIKDTLFDKDALVLKQFKSERVHLYSPKGKWLTFHLAGFPYLGIWSKSKESPFVCIEPWFGLADRADHNQKLIDKEGIIILKPQEKFSCAYTIELH